MPDPMGVVPLLDETVPAAGAVLLSDGVAPAGVSVTIPSTFMPLDDAVPSEVAGLLSDEVAPVVVSVITPSALVVDEEEPWLP